MSRTAAMCVFLTVGLSAPMGANMVCWLLLASFLLCLRPCCFESLILTALHVCFKFSLESVILPQALEKGIPEPAPRSGSPDAVVLGAFSLALDKQGALRYMDLIHPQAVIFLGFREPNGERGASCLLSHQLARASQAATGR